METHLIREVCLKYRAKRKQPLPVVYGPECAAEFLRKILPDNVREHFAVLFLSGNNSIVGYSIMATGTANSCQIHPREVFQAAILAGSVSIVIAHNHPSDSTRASEADNTVTNKIMEGGKLLGIPVLDHIIVTDNAYYSYKESGQL